MSLREFAWLAGTMAASLTIATIVEPLRPLLIWNVSASAPLGLYFIRTRSALKGGDTVAARLPLRWRALAAERGYLPSRVPLIKRIAALPGQRICAAGATVTIDGRAAARRLRSDPRGRVLPWWNGCVTLHPGQLFLLNAPSSSFDGRYFGVTNTVDLIGKATLIWRG